MDQSGDVVAPEKIDLVNIPKVNIQAPGNQQIPERLWTPVGAWREQFFRSLDVGVWTQTLRARFLILLVSQPSG
jgi:hypothetical protein